MSEAMPITDADLKRVEFLSEHFERCGVGEDCRVEEAELIDAVPDLLARLRATEAELREARRIAGNDRAYADDVACLSKDILARSESLEAQLAASREKVAELDSALAKVCEQQIDLAHELVKSGASNIEGGMRELRLIAELEAEREKVRLAAEMIGAVASDRLCPDRCGTCMKLVILCERDLCCHGITARALLVTLRGEAVAVKPLPPAEAGGHDDWCVLYPNHIGDCLPSVDPTHPPSEGGGR